MIIDDSDRYRRRLMAKGHLRRSSGRAGRSKAAETHIVSRNPMGLGMQGTAQGLFRVGLF